MPSKSKLNMIHQSGATDGQIVKYDSSANEWIPANETGGGGGTSDHGTLTGLADNDHPQYVLSSTNLALSSLVTTNQGIVEDVSSTLFDNSSSWGAGTSDHGTLTGLADDDHPQYVLSATNLTLSSLVTTNQGLVEGVSSTVFDNSSTWSTDTNTTDHTALSNIGSNTHTDIDSHIADSTLHFTEASIDHGSIGGLGDNDHPQYTLSSTNLALSSLVTTNQGLSEGVSSTVFDNSSTWATDTNTTDHGAFTGLADDDHPQYVLSATNLTLSSLVTTNQGLTEAVSSTVFDNSGSWSEGDYLPLSGGDVTGGVTISRDVDTNTGNVLTLNTDVDSSLAGPVLSLDRDSDSPADGDYLGQIKFKGKNSTGGDVTYSKVTAKTSDVTNSTEDGLLEFANQKDGSQTIVARLTSTDLKLINGTGLEVDGDVSVTGTGPWTTVSSTVFDNSSTWSIDTNTTDHGAFTGLADDDHPQYTLSATNLALSSLVTTNQGLSEGVSSTVFDNSASWATDTNTTYVSSDFTHDDLTGFVADEHIDWTQDQGATNIHAGNYTDTNTTYVSSDFTHDDLTGFVADEHIDWTQAGAGTIHASNYVDNNTDTTYVSSDFTHDDLTGFVADEHIDWTVDQGATNIHSGNYTDTDTTDHTALSNIGSNSHTAIDSHIADSTLHFTEASIDHGSIGGLGGDDHPQYTLSATNLALSSLVTTNQGLAEGVSSTVFDNSASWGGGGGTTNLSIGTTTTTTVDVNSNTGTNATIPAAIATTAAGLLTGADKAKLDGIEAAAEVNVDTDLSKTVGASTVTIESSTGTNTEIPAVTGSLAGVLAAAQYNVILTALGRVALMEDSATADQTAAEILALLVGEKLATKSVGTDALVNKGTVTGATTIDWNDGNHQEITLGAAAITLTFTAPTQGTAMLVLNVKQDATGGRALTLPSIEYPRSGSPTYSTVADANDLHTFYWNGTTYQGGFGPAMG